MFYSTPNECFKTVFTFSVPQLENKYLQLLHLGGDGQGGGEGPGGHPGLFPAPSVGGQAGDTQGGPEGGHGHQVHVR